MKMQQICIFVDSSQKGGLDTFLKSLMQGWTGKFDRIVICSSSRRHHLALSMLKPNFDLTFSKFMKLGFPGKEAIESFVFKRRFLARGFGFAQLFTRYFIEFPFYVINLSFKFSTIESKKLLVVNGGHPGSVACLAAMFAWKLSKRHSSIVLNIHSLAAPKLPFFRPIETFIDRMVIWSADEIIVVSRATEKALCHRIGLVDKPIHVIQNGIVDPDSCPSSTNLNHAVKQKYCLILASFDSYKGHSFAIKAFSQVVQKIPGIRLWLAGTGSHAQVETIKKCVIDNKLENSVDLLGFVDEPFELIRNASLIIVPSLRYESFGLVIIEAMALARPVIATNVGGIPETLDDNVEGKIVNATDVNGLAEAIIKLVQSEGVSQSMGMAGRSRFLRCYTAQKMAAAYRKVLTNVGSGDHGQPN